MSLVRHANIFVHCISYAFIYLVWYDKSKLFTGLSMNSAWKLENLDTHAIRPFAHESSCTLTRRQIYNIGARFALTHKKRHIYRVSNLHDIALFLMKPILCVAFAKKNRIIALFWQRSFVHVILNPNHHLPGNPRGQFTIEIFAMTRRLFFWVQIQTYYDSFQIRCIMKSRVNCCSHIIAYSPK